MTDKHELVSGPHEVRDRVAVLRAARARDAVPADSKDPLGDLIKGLEEPAVPMPVPVPVPAKRSARPPAP